ncbi:hypothetical protein OHD62_16490 [Mesorhizobium sp. YC-39]|uniref:hypothetical protein n=1 Tax=unclassified Mesorhizobium TaxID=325217 RepID=UPI0021E8524A|nr:MULTISPECIES: hypothetical protein [unclassified Mesorhizobium]MCV3208242.1 hypothetical protein [Mesorhizobium sp. YC-2]MCV3229969.1 hypothetical protein [Mesorhizobium sp. YC-39]
MKHAIAIADRTALGSLKLLVALNVLFFLSFLAVALLAAGRMQAEIPVRTGADRLSVPQTHDPAGSAMTAIG